MELQPQLYPYARNLSERRFWIGLACVALLHAGMVVGVGRSAPRHLGERDGDPDAISVEFVDPLALRGASAEPGPADAAHPGWHWRRIWPPSRRRACRRPAGARASSVNSMVCWRMVGCSKAAATCV